MAACHDNLNLHFPECYYILWMHLFDTMLDNHTMACVWVIIEEKTWSMRIMLLFSMYFHWLPLYMYEQVFVIQCPRHGIHWEIIESRLFFSNSLTVVFELFNYIWQKSHFRSYDSVASLVFVQLFVEFENKKFQKSIVSLAQSLVKQLGAVPMKKFTS